MRKQTDYSLLAVLLVILIAVLAASCDKEAKLIQLPSHKAVSNVHTCRWAQCPYHGLKPNEYHYIVEYVGSYGTEAYYIDSLHLAYPNAEYEELEIRLGTIK